MRLVTFQSSTGKPHLGVVRGEQVVDLTAWWERRGLISGQESTDMVALISTGDHGLDLVREALDANEEEWLAASALVPLDLESLLAPIARPRKNVLCMGRNYFEHAVESARAFGEAPAEVPKYPIVFTKATTSVIGPYADIPYDSSVSERIDWEGELAVIIGRAGKNINRADAMQYVFGYMVLNDISARDIQVRHGNQFFKGKSLDGTCPIGPWIVTADEIPDPGNLELWTRVNGIEKQRGNTRDMIWDVPAIIEELSLGMTLEPGDIIATGTPSGVGTARTPPEYLRPGDVVECEVEDIGVIRNRIAGD